MLKMPVIANLGSRVLLERYLDCRSEEQAARLLEDLYRNHIQAQFVKTLMRKVSDPAEMESACGYARERMQQKLHTLREQRQGRRDGQSTTEIKDLPGFCRLCARQGFSLLLKEKYPEWGRLHNRLSELLKKQHHICAWKSAEGEPLCGLTAWTADRRERTRSDELERLEREPDTVAHLAVKEGSPQQASEAVLLYSLLQWVGHAAPLNSLIDAILRIRGLKVQAAEPRRSDDDSEQDVYDTVADPAQEVGVQLQLRATLMEHWEDINSALTVQQRRVMLLGMKDPHGGSGLKLLPPLRIAGYQQIAEALQIPWEEFGALWRELPLTDTAIAERFDTTPNNVRVQRNTARERLAKRRKQRDEEE